MVDAENKINQLMDELITDRQKKIIDLLIDEPTKSIREISKIFGVSSTTIRNDFNSLSNRGLLIRTHGGAVPSFHPDMIIRLRTNHKQKVKIAKKAATLINNGDSIFLDAGTTTAMIPKYLLGKQDIHIITNSTLPLPFMKLNRSIKITFIGGEFRFLDESFVGPLAIESISRFNANYAFIGTIGFSVDYGLTTYSLDISEVILQMVKHANKVVLCADSSKYNKKGHVTTMPISEIDYLIIDKGLDATAQREISHQGVEIILV